MPVEKVFAQWRVVNEQANEAERRLFEVSIDYLRGKGPAPREVDRVMATQLRAEARTLFVRALFEVDRAASGAKKAGGGQPPTPPGSEPDGSGSAT